MTGPGPCTVIQAIPLTEEQCNVPHLMGVNEKNGDVYVACVGGSVKYGNAILRFQPKQ